MCKPGSQTGFWKDHLELVPPNTVVCENDGKFRDQVHFYFKSKSHTDSFVAAVDHLKTKLKLEKVDDKSGTPRADFSDTEGNTYDLLVNRLDTGTHGCLSVTVSAPRSAIPIVSSSPLPTPPRRIAFRPKAATFEVMLPGVPEETEKKGAPGSGGGRIELKQRGDLWFALEWAYTATNPAIDLKDPAVVKRVLDAMRDNAFESSGARVSSTKDIKLSGKYPGREYVAVADKPGFAVSTIRMQQYLVIGDASVTTYELRGVTMDGALLGGARTQEDLQTFFDSFKLLATK